MRIIIIIYLLTWNLEIILWNQSLFLCRMLTHQDKEENKQWRKRVIIKGWKNICAVPFLFMSPIFCDLFFLFLQSVTRRFAQQFVSAVTRQTQQQNENNTRSPRSVSQVPLKMVLLALYYVQTHNLLDILSWQKLLFNHSKYRLFHRLIFKYCFIMKITITNPHCRKFQMHQFNFTLFSHQPTDDLQSNAKAENFTLLNFLQKGPEIHQNELELKVKNKWIVIKRMVRKKARGPVKVQRKGGKKRRREVLWLSSGSRKCLCARALSCTQCDVTATKWFKGFGGARWSTVFWIGMHGWLHPTEPNKNQRFKWKRGSDLRRKEGEKKWK